MADSTIASDLIQFDKPQQADLDRCVHCGLCLNACPTYRELGVEMDSPRGRIYQMVQVSNGALITDSYQEHLSLCLACRACETACPSGVEYGRLIEAARAEIENKVERPFASRMMRRFVFGHLLQSPKTMALLGWLLYVYQATGVQKLVRASGILNLIGKMGRLEQLAPASQPPFFFDEIGKTFPAEGQRRYRVALMAGCIANVSFARLNEATVRVLQKNGCEVVVPAGQGCCGALHVHAGIREEARKLARRNIDVVLGGKFDGKFDAILTNAAGCGSTLKEYDELLEHDAAYEGKAREFVSLMKDATEFLASIDLNRTMGTVPVTVTYQDSCHLLHGQKIRNAPRELLRAVPGLTFREMPLSDLCCGSAGVYNVVHTEMALDILHRKMDNVNVTKADVIATANPGCMLQLEAGVRLHGHGQRVAHVIEILDEAYRNA
ncbi:MAG: heterodisulfide reductase-related iron-sulfur binding cluster [Acidobacteriota bacterium]|nr:heterodisulfide reductase-related iron-sulfur binding cluster [Acidobacteriota bacterium]